MTESIFTCPKCGSDDTMSTIAPNYICMKCRSQFVPEAPFEPLRVFISYGHDEHVAVALRLRDDLNQRGHEAWFDEERLHPGHDWEASIERGLQWAANSGQKAALVLLLTPHSVRRPDGYCLNEVARALTLGLRIIPLMVVDSEPPLSICRIQWLDLRECIPIHEREDRYAPKVERLLAALEQNRLDFEGTQSRLLRALAPMEFSARILEKLQDFTGRQWVFDEIDRWMNDPAGSKIFWLTGAPGVGKTAVAAWVQQHRREVAAFHFCDIHHEEKRNPAKMVRSIAYQLSTQLPEYEARLAQLTPTVDAIVQEYHEAYTLFDKLVIQPLTQSFPAPDRTLVVLIDALDEATFERQNEIAHFLGSCAHLTPPWLRFLVTSRPDEPEIKPHLQSLDPYVLGTAREENLADLREYLHAQLPGITAAQTDEIVSRSEGVFLYVTHVTEEVKVGRLSLDRLEEFPRGLGDVYAGFFKRQFGKELAFYEEKITPLLQVVFAAFEPLTLADLKAVCHLPDATELGRRLNRLGSLFPTRGHGDTATLVPFHRSLVDWITDRNAAGHYWLDVRDGHRLLAEQGLAQVRASVAALSSYQLRYLPAHLCELGLWDALAGDDNTPGVLTDLSYIQAKCTAGLTHDLVGDYNQVLSQMSGAQDDSTEAAIRLRHFSNFVSHHLGVLTEYPAETLPIAVNYANRGPVVTQAECLLDEGKVPHLRRTNRPELMPVRPACLRKIEGHFGSVRSLTAMLDGRHFVSGGDDGDIRFWDMETGKCLNAFGGLAGSVLSVTTTPDGKNLFTGINDDGNIFVWDLHDGKLLCMIEGHEDSVQSITITQDGKFLGSGSSDQTIRIWDLDTGKCFRILEGHRDSISSVALTPNGRKIVSGSWDCDIRLWDLETGQCSHVFKGHNDSINSVALTSNGQYIISGSKDKTIRVWDLKSGKNLSILNGHQGEVNCVALAMDGKYIFSGSSDKTIRVWDLDNEQCINIIKGHMLGVNSIAVMNCGKNIISASDDKMIRVWDWQIEKTIHFDQNIPSTVNTGVITPDGKRIILGSSDKTVRVLDAEKGECLRVFEGHTGSVNCVAVKPDGSQIFSGSSDRTIRIWDMEIGQCIRILSGHLLDITSITLTPNSRNLVSGSSDETVRVWDVGSGQCLYILKGDDLSINTYVSLTPDGKSIISGGEMDGTLRVWSFETGHCLSAIKGQIYPVSCITLTPDGKKIVTGGELNGSILVWDLDSKRCVNIITGNKGIVRSALVLPDGKRIVYGGGEKKMQVSELETGILYHIHILSSLVTTIILSPLGDRIVAGTADGQIHILTPVNFTLCETPMLTEL